jgi:hypothetical protein
VCRGPALSHAGRASRQGVVPTAARHLQLSPDWALEPTANRTHCAHVIATSPLLGYPKVFWRSCPLGAGTQMALEFPIAGFPEEKVENTVYLGEGSLVPLEVRCHDNPNSS